MKSILVNGGYSITQVTPEEAMNQISTEEARGQRWLDFEASLARAQYTWNTADRGKAEKRVSGHLM